MARLFLGKENYIRFFCFALVLIISCVIFYKLYLQASDPALQGNQGYVSDEIWYADSARNILRVFFNVQTQYVDSKGYAYYTLIFDSSKSRDAQLYNFQVFLKEHNGDIVEIYTQFPGVAFKVPNNETLTLNLENVTMLLSGYPYPDVSGIYLYLNLEHPPLAKYIIGISMILNGDKPISWRLPSIILSSLLPVVVFFIVRRLSNSIIAAISSVFFLFDTLLFNEGFLALLDVYLAFFIALSLLFAVYNRFTISSIFIGLAAAVKISGVFLIFPLLIYLLFGTRKSIFNIIIISFIIPLITWILANLPIIYVLGIKEWIQSVISALSWHTTSRPQGPPTSLPWGWLYNQNPFFFHFNPTYSASVNVPIYILAFLSIILTPYLLTRLKKEFALPTLWLLGIFLGYSILPLLGNSTLYSFYAFAFIPMIYSIFPNHILSWLSKSPRSAISDFFKTYEAILKRFFTNELSIIKAFAIVSIFISFILHLPSWLNPLGLYSDIVYTVYPMQGIGSFYSGIPYIDFVFDYPVFVGILVLFASKIAWALHPSALQYFNESGLLIFYFINFVFIAVAAYYIAEDIYHISIKTNSSVGRAIMFFGFPALIIYGVYSWILIALAFLLRSIRLFMEGRYKSSYFLLSLSIATNLYSALVLLPYARELWKISKKKVFQCVFFSLALFSVYNLPFAILGYLNWYKSFIASIIPGYIMGSWIVLVFGNP
ncbi:MAG TPA: glycosyltransferase family 39 protein, partial [Geobacterales bacterium]|nr:glycosyltransferase family 39 protein [Geobacterales bacterium]